MPWIIEFAESAKKELLSIDRQAARRITQYLTSRIATDEDPRRFGAGLKSNLAGLWKYRVGDYRIVAEIQDDRVVVLVVRVAHRSKVYGGQ